MKSSSNRIRSLVGIVVSAGVLVAASSASAAFPGANGKIAFVSGAGNSFAIHVMEADGSRRTRLTNGIEPAWSPDGSEIAFASLPLKESEIYVIKADGSGRMRLTNSRGVDAEPAWSPDGRKIVFASGRAGGDAELYVMNADGSGRRQLTEGAGFAEYPAWSPDGRKIAFQSGPLREIFVVNADGSGQRQLTNNAPHLFDIQPDWSPDGSRIAFTSNRGDVPFPGSENHEVYLMNADGSGQTQLTNHPATDLEVAWSPDGRRLAFASNRDGNPEIYAMNLDGSGLTRLTNSAGMDTSPDWQPVGAARGCRVPRVLRQSLKAAKHAIRRAGCSVGRIKLRPSGRVKRGRIVSQNPRAGKRRPSGARVNLVLSRG